MARVRDTEKYAQQVARILQEAARLFRAKGYHATTLEEIADQLGMTSAALYYYYPKKVDLLLAICEDTMGAALDKMEEVILLDEPADVRLRKVVTAHITILAANIEAWSVFFHERGFEDNDRYRVVLGKQKQFADNLEVLIKEGMQGGVFRQVDVRPVMLGLLGMVNSVHIWLRREGRSLDEVIAALVDFIEHGILSRPSNRRAPRRPGGSK